MMRWSLYAVIASALAGCALSNPLPDDWRELELPAIETPTPVDLPGPPLGTIVDVDGREGLQLTAGEVAELDFYVEQAEANQAIAEQLSTGLRELTGAYGAVVTKGQAQRDIAEAWRVRYEEERRGRIQDRFSVLSILALIGLIAVH